MHFQLITRRNLFQILYYLLVSVQLIVAIKVYDVTKFNVKPDGLTKNTAAIRDVIETASRSGGGIVYFPKGNYMTGAIHLKTNVSLDIDSGAVIKFSNDFDDYLPMVAVRWGGIQVINFSPLIYSNEAENIGITGKGTIDGNGEKWWDFWRNLRNNSKKSGHWDTDSKWQQMFLKLNQELIANITHLVDDDTDFKHAFFRPQFIQTFNSKNIVIKGITIKDSPFWTVTPAFSDDITIDGVTIENPIDSPNTDGIDPDSCRNVLITNCSISVGDDCVCIKSGKDRQGLLLNRPSENILIRDCKMFSGHGGVVIGSETSGSVRNVTAFNLYFDGTDRGVRIKSTRGRGGVVENINISNIVMKNMKREGITINTYYTKTVPEKVSDRTPIFKNINLFNISGTAKLAIQLMGLPEMPIRNISLTDIHIDGNEDIIISDVQEINLKNVTTKIIK